ncbi:hypothetical protein HG536_0C02510 [Torulaspora globosa]|uniref:Mediator of RNA polymerase II transcription subunit 18 n=1 Tax=Torulaspora globosa TaxID=48254 RepID=A0A7G3ZEZ6_9SACH|nr:uncharacterized protein HG536_0C02510 [Torulaspora globosa]QLL32082.1 hypothetical protein HG536_0C02510 [Torulaspora globosa]
MVHQLSLFHSIDDDSFELFISTMTIMSGNPPVLFGNLSRVWKPNEAYDIERANSKNQLVELNRIKLSREVPLHVLLGAEKGSASSYALLKDLADKDLPVEPASVTLLLEEAAESVNEKPNAQSTNSPWALSISDIPAAGGNRKVSVQTISESVILSVAGQDSSLSKFLKELGYIESYKFLTVGVKFHMKNDLMLVVQKIWDVEKKRQMTKGGYLIKAFINVSRGTDIERINQAENTLVALRKDLQGYIDLSIPDRKAMDSRLDYLNDNL